MQVETSLRVAVETALDHIHLMCVLFLGFLTPVLRNRIYDSQFKGSYRPA
jgi:hypothetical protein